MKITPLRHWRNVARSAASLARDGGGQLRVNPDRAGETGPEVSWHDLHVLARLWRLHHEAAPEVASHVGDVLRSRRVGVVEEQVSRLELGERDEWSGLGLLRR